MTLFITVIYSTCSYLHVRLVSLFHAIFFTSSKCRLIYVKQNYQSIRLPSRLPFSCIPRWNSFKQNCLLSKAIIICCRHKHEPAISVIYRLTRFIPPIPITESGKSFMSLHCTLHVAVLVMMHNERPAADFFCSFNLYSPKDISMQEHSICSVVLLLRC